MDPETKSSPSHADYRLGTLYGLATAILLALQPPFSAPAARNLTSIDFMGFTQCALLFSVPLLIARADSRRDFAVILLDLRYSPKLAVVFCVGVIGLALFDIGLSSAHPIITAATLNLTPFWAALVAFVVTKRSLSISPSLFFGSFLTAFCGAMVIAWSQIDVEPDVLLHDVLERPAQQMDLRRSDTDILRLERNLGLQMVFGVRRTGRHRCEFRRIVPGSDPRRARDVGFRPTVSLDRAVEGRNLAVARRNLGQLGGRARRSIRRP